MSELQNNKKLIERELGELSSDLVLTAKKIKEAEGAGDKEKAFSLREQGLVLDREAERLESEYNSLQEQEAKPELERIGKLSEELRSPYTSPLQYGYSRYPMMPGAIDTTVNISSPSIQEQKERKQAIVAELYNLPKTKNEKIPTPLMAKVETLYTPESKAELLEKTYGKGSVLPVDVAGETEFIIRLPDKSVKTTFDKGVAALAGIAAQIPVAAAEIASFLAIGGATKSPILAVAGSSVVGGGVGTGIDEALRFAYGLPSDLGGTMARRGTEAVIGAGTGGITDVAIPIMRANRIPNPFENKFAQELESAAERLMTKEQKLAAKEGRKAGQIQVPAGARLAGQQGLEMQSELAGTYARSNITSAALTTQETLLRLAKDVKLKIPATPNDYADIAAQKEAQKDAISGQISLLTGRSKRIIGAALDRQSKGPLSNTDSLGKILRNEIKNAEDQAIKSTNEQYDVLADVAEVAKFEISAREVIDMLPGIKASINPGGAVDDSAVRKVEQDLMRQRDAPFRIYDAEEKLKSVRRSLVTLNEEKLSGKKITEARLNQIKASELRYQGQIQNLSNEIKELQNISGPLDFKGFDAYIKRFNDARPDNAVGGTTKDVFGAGISKELSELRRNIYGQFNATYPDGTVKNLGDEFKRAAELVQARGAFEKNTLGGILKESAGEQATTPRDIVKSVLKEPFTVERVTRAIRELGTADPTKAGEADRLLGLLQSEYINNIGIGRGGASQVKIDDGMLNALFGKEAAAQKRSIEELNRNIGKIKGLDASKLSLDDIKRMGQSISENERKSLIKTISQRIKDEKQEESIVTSTIFKIARKGDYKNIDSDTLSKAILSSSSSTAEANAAMRELSKMSIEARNLYKGDFMRELLDQFPGGTPTANAPFETLFDTKKFIAAYQSPNETGKTAFAKKLEIVLGPERARELYDIARLYEANIVTNTSGSGFNPRFVATNRGVILGIPFGQLALSTKNRIITGMLSSNSQRNTLKRALSKTAMPGAVNDAYNKMARDAFLTRTGITALAHQASNDPEFSAELTNMVNGFKEKEGLELEGE